MHRTLSEIEEIINSTHSAELIPIKCENCGSKIKQSNLGKHSQCSIYKNSNAKSFLKREAFPLELKLQPPTKLDMFIIGNTAKEEYQSIAPPLFKHNVQSLRILEPQPDTPIKMQSKIQYQVVEYSRHEVVQDISQFSLHIQDKQTNKQNFDNLSIYSKKQQLLPTTARQDRTARNYDEEARQSAISGRSYYSREEITYRPTVVQYPSQISQKENSFIKTAKTTESKGGLFSIFSCTTQHGAAIKQHQIVMQPLPNHVCPCCLRQNHQSQNQHSSSQKLNNYQIQKKKLLYDRWLSAKSQFKSIPSVSFEEAYKKNKYLKQQQFSTKIREYFY